MTREEARKIIKETSGRFHEPDGMADCLLDTYTALGMLKLDEPKSAWERFRETFVELDCYDPDDSDPATVISDVKIALERSNLKIVEK